MIDKLLDQFHESLGETFIIGIEAQHFIAYCQQNHPAELAQWLQLRAPSIVGDELRSRLHKERANARQQAGARAFRDAVADLDTAEGRTLFESYYAVNHRNLWKRLGAMTNAELVYVADRYEGNGQRALMWAALFKHLARQVGPDETVADVFTEGQVVHLQRQYLDPTAQPVASPPT